MFGQRACSVFLWILMGLAILTVVIQYIQFARISIHLYENTTIQVKKAEVMNFDEDDVLPGPYNLLSDAGVHSNALNRPTKECTLGN
jgi:hypothetical protein